MKRKKQKTTQTVSIMANPIMQRVSLVDRGANETPIAVVKSKKLCDTENAKEKTMPEVRERKASPKAKTNEANVRKFMFEKAQYTSKDTVESFLTQRGYQDFEVTETDTHYVAASKSNEVLTDVTTMPYTDDPKGVQVEIGRVAKSEEAKGDDKDGVTKETVLEEKTEEASESEAQEDGADGSDTTEAGEDKESTDSEGTESAEVTEITEGTEEAEQKAAEVKKSALDISELVKKYDYWEAIESGSTTLDGVLKDGFDGLPIGTWELVDAMTTAVKNSFLNNDVTAAGNAIDRFKDLVVMLHNGINGLPPVQKTAARKAVFSKAAKTEVAKSAESKNETMGLDLASLEDLNALIANIAGDVVAKAITGIAQKQEQLEIKMGTLDSSYAAKSDVDAVAKELTETKETVAKLSKVRPTLKSNDEFSNDYASSKEIEETEVRKESPAMSNFRNSLPI